MELLDLPEHLRAGAQRQIDRQNAGKVSAIPKLDGTLLEEDFLAILKRDAPDLLPPEKQFAYAPGSRRRADFCYPNARLLVEMEGGILDKKPGGHSSISGLLNDCSRSKQASANGYRVFRVSRWDLDNSPAQMVELLRAAVKWKAKV